MKVSVIVPIYKVERFIARCVTSLMKQTLQDVEYIFVDDATPDQSLSILQEVLVAYPERKKYVKYYIIKIIKAYLLLEILVWKYLKVNISFIVTVMIM